MIPLTTLELQSYSRWRECGLSRGEGLQVSRCEFRWGARDERSSLGIAFVANVTDRKTPAKIVLPRESRRPSPWPTREDNDDDDDAQGHDKRRTKRGMSAAVLDLACQDDEDGSGDGRRRRRQFSRRSRDRRGKLGSGFLNVSRGSLI